MDRRLIVGILLLALAWQGPALAYSAIALVSFALGVTFAFILPKMT